MSITGTTPATSLQSAPTDRRISAPWDSRRVLLLSIAVAFLIGSVWGLRRTEMSLAPIIEGWPETQDLLARMWPPKLAGEDVGIILRAILDTFFMAVLGTVIAVALSIPLGFLAASNVVSNPVVRWTARGIIAFSRAVPALMLGLIFVRVFSIGVLAGVVALGLHSIGFCGKLFADAAENIEIGQREGVAATGASRLQELVAGVWSQMVPSVIATSLYRLEINFRDATLLGLVGAGGIGLQINAYKGSLRYPEMIGVTLIVIVTVIAMELLSSAARRSLLGGTQPLGSSRTSGRVSDLLRRHRRPPELVTVHERASVLDIPSVPGAVPLRQPWTRDRVKLNLLGWLTVVLVALGFIVPEISFVKFITSIRKVPETFWKMVPRDTSFWIPEVRADLIETLAIGFAATFMALVLAIPVSFLAASNVSPNRWVYRVTRVAMILVRATPDLVVAVIFVAAIGLGPRTGAIALAVGMFGFATRLFSDTIEEARMGPREGVLAAGATRLQETTSAVTPQVLPSLVGQALYVFDVSLRSSAVLGIVGAGGIGFLFSNGMRTLQFEFVGGLILCVFVMVYSIELVTSWVRKQLI